MDRRRFVRAAVRYGAVPSTTLLLGGCAPILRALAESCPEDPEESGGVDWTPDVLRPVFYGFQELTAADGAPGRVRVWYPSYEGFVDGPPILKLCLVRWPVVLFLHGQPPCPDADYHRRWTRLPATLARSGYVVVVPSHGAGFPAPDTPAADAAWRFVEWVRNDWDHAHWVDKRPEATAVAGHSYGALLGAHVARQHPEVSAYVGLGGPWPELGDPFPTLENIGAPSFFMWGDDLPLENLDGGGMWNAIPPPKHGAVYPGEHFDYLPPRPGCAVPRGSCNLIEAVTADLAALFITRYAPVALSGVHIPVSLERPPVTLSTNQHFFAGGHLTGLSQIEGRAGCRVDLRWIDGTSAGSRRLGT